MRSKDLCFVEVLGASWTQSISQGLQLCGAAVQPAFKLEDVPNRNSCKVHVEQLEVPNNGCHEQLVVAPKKFRIMIELSDVPSTSSL